MKKYIALTLALLMSLSLMACGSKTDDGSSDQEGSNTLVLGTSADYAPFEFMYADESGAMQYAGIDISAAQYIADEMGKELQIENMSFDYLLTSLPRVTMTLSWRPWKPRPSVSPPLISPIPTTPISPR